MISAATLYVIYLVCAIAASLAAVVGWIVRGVRLIRQKRKEDDK